MDITLIWFVFYFFRWGNCSWCDILTQWAVVCSHSKKVYLLLCL